MLWEYGDKVNPDIFMAWKLNKAAPAAPDDMHGPTLKRIVAAFEKVGYHSYLSSGYLGEAAFLPLTGGYWHDALELCRVPHGKVCCFDIVSTVAGGPEDLAILARPIPLSWIQKFHSKPKLVPRHERGSVAACDSRGLTYHGPF